MQTLFFSIGPVLDPLSPCLLKLALLKLILIFAFADPNTDIDKHEAA